MQAVIHLLLHMSMRAAVPLASALLLAFPIAAGTHEPCPALFDAARKPRGIASAICKWQDVPQHSKAESEHATPAVENWRKFLVVLAQLPAREVLEQVNEYVNGAKYRRDDSHIGMGSDCWATPGKLFADGGDCEDYAIAKYLSLRRLGFLPNALHIEISYNRTTCKVHTALVAIPDGEALLLDNRLPRVDPDASKIISIYFKAD